MAAFQRIVKDIGLLVARLVVGGALVAHGWHLLQVMGVQAAAAELAERGIDNAASWAWVIVAVGLLGGILLVFGLGTRLVGVALLVVSLAFISLLELWGTFFLRDGGWEYLGLLAVLGIVFLTQGGGRFGVDALFIRPADEHTERFIGEPV